MNKSQTELFEGENFLARHRNFRLGVKLALMVAGSVLITAIALVLITIWQSAQYNWHAQKEIDILINTDLKHISQVIYNLVQSENDAIRMQLKSHLNIACHVFSDYGPPSLSKEQVKWEITNQLTNNSNEISLPKFLTGNRWIEKNPSLSVETPVIGKICDLIGETASIFQLINDKCDMLRIATNIETGNQTRAIGTYLPSINPDGAKNPVISKIKNGEIYQGRSLIEDEWYFTAYTPIYDNNGKLIGMLNVGIKQKTVESRIRDVILQTSVGKTGYVYVLEGNGKNRGRYIISYKGERDGENIWSTTDSDGRLVIHEIVNKAIVLKPGEMDTTRYRWQNPGEPSPRWKIANLVYFEPWDWVIGTSVYEDELQAYTKWLNDGRRTLVNIMGIAGIMITLVVVMLFIFFTLKITRPVKDIEEEAFTESRNYLDEIINAVGDPVFVKDDKYRLVLINNAMCDFIGRSRNDILGKTDYDYCISEEADKFRDSDKKVLESGKDCINESLFTDSDRNIHIILTRRTLYIDKNDNRFIVGIIRDISDQKAAEDEKIRLETRLTQSQKMEAIGTLAGGIAHDFNNILSAIIGYTEVAIHNINRDKKVMSSLNEVLVAGERAQELVKQILTFSRMSESGNNPILLDQVMKDSLRMLRAVIPSNIKIKQDINISGYVLSNSTQITQIMLNLCSNAAHSMDPGGGILDVKLERISVEGNDNPYGVDAPEGRYLKITISDTGTGMPEELRVRIFEPYFTTEDAGSAAGLGLSVIHGIVKSHNGDIICKGNENGGTTFEVYLPEEKDIKEKEDTLSEDEVKTGNGKILVIDDDPVLVKLIVEMLEIMGYDAVSSVSSKEGLRIFRDAPKDFDLVITDMTMPEITGDMLAQEIISIRSNIPIILCTGFNEHISEAQAKEIGISEFIMKPVNMKLLSSAIQRVIH